MRTSPASTRVSIFVLLIPDTILKVNRFEISVTVWSTLFVLPAPFLSTLRCSSSRSTAANPVPLLFATPAFLGDMRGGQSPALCKQCSPLGRGSKFGFKPGMYTDGNCVQGRIVKADIAGRCPLVNAPLHENSTKALSGPREPTCACHGTRHPAGLWHPGSFARDCAQPQPVQSQLEVRGLKCKWQLLCLGLGRIASDGDATPTPTSRRTHSLQRRRARVRSHAIAPW